MLGLDETLQRLADESKTFDFAAFRSIILQIDVVFGHLSVIYVIYNCILLSCFYQMLLIPVVFYLMFLTFCC